MSKKANLCEECKFFKIIEAPVAEFDHIDGSICMFNVICKLGHKIRYYNPKHMNDDNFGWKRRCDDFRKEKKCQPGHVDDVPR